MAEGVRYIKVSKKDKNGEDQTNTLQSINELTIPFSSGNVTYDILSISEQPTYFLYYVENPNLEWADHADISYSFSGSYSGTMVNGNTTPAITANVDNQEFFLEGGESNNGLGSLSTPGDNFPTDSYRISTYIQKNIGVRISSSIQFIIQGGRTATTSVSSSVRLLSAPLTPGTLSANPKVHFTTILSQSIHDLDDFNNFVFTGSYDVSTLLNSGSFQPGDCLYLDYRAAFDGDEFGTIIGGYANGQAMTNITLNNGLFEISSSGASGPEIETVPEPFFSQDFAIAHDCQPTFNNVIVNRRGYLHQEVDYTTGVYLPTNFDLIINEKALKAQIQDSNYTTKRHIRPRYEGSKNTTDDFNSSAITQSTIFQVLHPNDDLGVSTFQLPSVESLDSTIHEFSYGGGTYPEIYGGGTVKISQLLNVSDKDSVSVISPLTENFNEILEQKFTPNSQPYVTQYTTISEETAGARVLGTNIGIPTISNYMVPSGFGTSLGAPSSLTTLDLNNFPFPVIRNSDGFYTTGSRIDDAEVAMGYIIQSTLENDPNTRWYITIYNFLPDVVQGDLQPFNSGSSNDYTGIDSKGGYTSPLTVNGVYEIKSVALGITYTISPALPQTGFTFGNNSKGYLIWKDNGSKNVIFNDATFSGVGKGNLITVNPTQIIKDNLIYISKTYGENT